MLAETLLQWLGQTVVPLTVALIVAIPTLVTSLQIRKDNRSQHTEGRDLLQSLDAKVSSIDTRLTAVDARVSAVDARVSALVGSSEERTVVEIPRGR